MIKRSLRLFLIYILTLSLTYAPILRADQLSLPSTDLIAPQVIHDPIKEAMAAGKDKKFSAIVTDNVGVQSVTLFYRTVGAKDYKRKPMIGQGSDTYSATVDASEMQEPGVEYYIQATDQAGNNLLHGYSFSPLIVNVSATAAPKTAKTVAAKEEPKDIAYTPKEESSNKWLWIGLGVLAVAAAAGGGGGGGGTSGATLTINTTEPTP